MEVIEIKDRKKFFALSQEMGTVFSSEPWSKVMGEKLKLFGIFSDNSLVGGFVIYQTRMKLVKSWITPPFAPHIALFFIPAKSSNASKILSYNKWILRAVAEFISKQNPGFVKIELPPQIGDAQPFMWQGMDVTIKYTYQLDLSLGNEDLMQRIVPKARSKISAGRNSGLIIDRNADAESIIAILQSTFSKKAISTDFNLVERIVNNLSGSNACFTSVVKGDGQNLGAFVCVYDSRSAYYLLGGFADEAKSKYIGHIGIWDCIMQAKEKGLGIFDFEGSMIPGVEHFFRSFGGNQVSYLEIRGGNKMVRAAHRLLRG